MNLLPIIVCAFGTCFNPYQVTFMETLRLSDDCKINFSGDNNYYITIEDHNCDEVSEQINKQILEKSGK